MPKKSSAIITEFLVKNGLARQEDATQIAKEITYAGDDATIRALMSCVDEAKKVLLAHIEARKEHANQTNVVVEEARGLQARAQEHQFLLDKAKKLQKKHK